MLTAPIRQHLEWKNLLIRNIEGNELGVEDEILNVVERGDILFKELNDIRVGHCHILQITRVDRYCGLRSSRLAIEVNLGAEAIVFVLTSEADVFKALEDDIHTLGRLGQHRLEGNANTQMAFIA